MKLVLFCLVLLSHFCLNANAQVLPIDEVISPDDVQYPQNEFTKVAVLQWNPESSAPVGAKEEVAREYLQKNRKKIAEYIVEANKKGAEMFVTSEFATVGYPDIPELPSEEDNFRNREDLKPFVETIPGPTTKYFSYLAKKLKMILHIGLAEVDAKTDLYHNTVVVIGADGEIITKYRKIHLYQVEEKFLVPGTEAVTYENQKLGKVALAICSDIYSDHPMNDYVSLKPNVLSISTSWADWNSGWKYFTNAAIKVGAYTLAANQEYFPDSGVLNPDGTVQSHIRQSKGLAYGFIPKVK